MTATTTERPRKLRVLQAILLLVLAVIASHVPLLTALIGGMLAGLVGHTLR